MTGFLQGGDPRLDEAEDNVCDHQGHYDVESLGYQKSVERLAVLLAENLLEARL